MMPFPIAIQLYSVRDELDKDFTGTLEKVKRIGFDGVELAGLYGYKPAEVKQILGDIDLVPISAHIGFEELMADPAKVMGEYVEIGCKYIVMGLAPEHRPGAEKFNEGIEIIKEIGKAAKATGITLLYHNHDFEFKKLDGEYGLDILYNSVSSDLLQTEVDTCWVNVAGENPSAYLRKYAGRSPVVHLKDFVMSGKKPEKIYSHTDIDNEKKETETAAFEFRPLGLGVQNFPEILKACKDAGTSWVVIEQDSPSMGKTPLECAEISINYLKNITGGTKNV